MNYEQYRANADLEFRSLKKDAFAHRPLTPGQWQVVEGLAEGKRYKQIAYERGFTEGTVKTYVHNIGRKLGLSGSLEICAWYYHKLIDEIRSNNESQRVY